MPPPIVRRASGLGASDATLMVRRGGLPLPFGRVVGAIGDAPAPVGAACEVAALPVPDDCVGQIRCGGVVVHSFGCTAPPATRLRGHGPGVLVDSAVLGWHLNIDTATAPLPAIAPPLAGTP